MRFVDVDNSILQVLDAFHFPPSGFNLISMVLCDQSGLRPLGASSAAGLAERMDRSGAGLLATLASTTASVRPEARRAGHNLCISLTSHAERFSLGLLARERFSAWASSRGAMSSARERWRMAPALWLYPRSSPRRRTSETATRRAGGH